MDFLRNRHPIEKENENDSPYAIYIVWFLAMTGLFSIIFGNIFFKIIGIFVVVMCLGVLVQIGRKRNQDNIKNKMSHKGGKNERRK